MTFPQSIITFTTKRDIKDTVYAEHVNTIQAELSATQAVIGTSALTSTWSGSFSKSPTWSSIGARIANLEAGAGAPSSWVSLHGGSVVISDSDVAGITIKHNGYSTQPQLQILDSSAVSVASISPDGTVAAHRARVRPVSTEIGVEVAASSTYAGNPIVGTSDGSTVWFINKSGGLTHTAGSFTDTGLVVSPPGNTEAIRVNATAAQTMPLVNLVKNNQVVTQISPAGVLTMGGSPGSARLVVDPVNTRVIFRSSQTRDYDALILVTGGSESSLGDMGIYANRIVLGTSTSRVTVNGAVDMPNMRNVFWTYVPPGGGDDDLYMPQNTTSWALPENVRGEPVTTGTTFIAPVSGSVTVNVYARIQAGSSPTALSYSLFQGSSAASSDANKVFDPSINWSVFLNGTSGDPPNNITSASLMSMRRITGLVPGSSYAMRLYFQNSNTGSTKWQNSKGEDCLMLRQVGIMVIPEL